MRVLDNPWSLESEHYAAELLSDALITHDYEVVFSLFDFMGKTPTVGNNFLTQWLLCFFPVNLCLPRS